MRRGVYNNYITLQILLLYTPCQRCGWFLCLL